MREGGTTPSGGGGRRKEEGGRKEENRKVGTSDGSVRRREDEGVEIAWGWGARMRTRKV